MRRWLIAGLTVAALIGAAPASAAEDTYSGSQMWLHYVPVSDAALLARYRAAVASIVVENADAEHGPPHTRPNLAWRPASTEKLVETSLEAARDELVARPRHAARPAGAGRATTAGDGAVVVGTRASSPLVARRRSRPRTWRRSATRAT